MEVDCFKDMYQIAKKLKTMKIKSILENIVEQGFDASCQGYYNMNRIAAWRNPPEEQKFYVDIKNFASVGMKLSLMLFGEENKETVNWKDRMADPIKYFEEEQKKNRR